MKFDYYSLIFVAVSSNGVGDVELPVDQSQVIFIGTGTSEGIPRVSCLTNPSTKCPVQ